MPGRRPPLPARASRPSRRRAGDLGRLARGAAAALAAAALAACSTLHYPVNAPIDRVDPDHGYRLENLLKAPGDEELLVVLTFSGGGARAAALSYGVLEELARHRIHWRDRDESLLDEVDLVYGVSGGAITAADFALEGDGILHDFVPRFLQRNIQKQLVDSLFSVSDLWRLSSPWYGRGELLQERLDDALFHGATFADLDTRRRGPFAVITATDMATGARFDFTQEYFDLLCSDLDAFPLARAVAASSDVPLLFAPITLRNYAGRCGPPPDLDARVARTGTAVERDRRQHLVDDIQSYADADRRPWIHLVDGGLSDNMAVRGLLDAGALTGGARQLGQALHFRHVRAVLFVVVDAANEETYAEDRSDAVPGPTRVAGAVADIPIKRMSRETKLLLQETLARAQADLARGPGGGIPLYYADVSLRAVKDAATRETLLALPTTLYLPPRDVRALREAGGRLLRDSPAFEQMLRALPPATAP